MKENPYTHFYLYAKGWYGYRNSSSLTDLRHIVANYSGISFNFVSENDVYSVMSQIVEEEITKHKSISAIRVIDRVVEDGWVRAFLSVLADAPSGVLKNGRLPLGKFDGSILK